MAQVIEFYIPNRFPEKGEMGSYHPAGKVLEFPAEVKNPHERPRKDFNQTPGSRVLVGPGGSKRLGKEKEGMASVRG